MGVMAAEVFKQVSMAGDVDQDGIGEMRGPSARIAAWAAIVCQAFSPGMTPDQRELLDGLAHWSGRLEAALADSRPADMTPAETVCFLRDRAGAPIEAIRAKARMLLLDFDQDHVDWQETLENISAAADYLYALRRDLLSKVDQINP